MKPYVFPQPSTTTKRGMDGGPLNGEPGTRGMQLRDYFAAKAMIALMSNEPWLRGMDAASDVGQFKSNLAAHAYLMADAMLKAREE